MVESPPRAGPVEVGPVGRPISPAVPDASRAWATWLVAAGAALAALVLHGYRLDMAPDVFSDEALYLQVARNVARGLGPVADNGGFFWHPPLFMLVEGLYLRLAGLADADFFTALYSARYVNVAFSAATAALLVLFGRNLHGLPAGALMAGLFVLDPYVERINRRGMLETLAMLLALIGFYLFFTRRARLTRLQEVACGVAFGLAMLTKELMFVQVVALVAYAAIARRAHLTAALRIAVLAFGPYILFALWAYATGQWQRFVEFRLYNVNKFLNQANVLLPGLGDPAPRLVPDIQPGVTRIGSGLFWENLTLLAGQYGSSYAIIGGGALATALLLIGHRGHPAPKLLIVWSAISFGFIGFGITIGKISDQFFYYLVVPAIVVLGYAAGRLLERPPTAWSRVLRGALGVTLAAMALFNLNHWYERYAIGVDNSYYRVYQYVVANVPPGSQIVPSGDLANYLFPGYNIQFHRDVQSVIDTKARYFLFSSKEASLQYNHIRPEFYGWVRSATRPLYEVDGPTFWTLGIYYRDPTPIPAAVLERVYREVLGRPIDAEGLRYWEQSETPPDQVGQVLCRSDEGRARGCAEPTAEVVEQLYREVLGRPGDAEGVARWVSSGLTAWRIRLAMCGSDEGQARGCVPIGG